MRKPFYKIAKEFQINHAEFILVAQEDSQIYSQNQQREIKKIVAESVIFRSLHKLEDKNTYAVQPNVL